MIAGVDEVGRGCIFGPVIASVVMFEKDYSLPGLTDSKKLTARTREILAKQIKNDALQWAIGRAEPSEIDHINILRASLLAMQRACLQLTEIPEMALVDGTFCPELPFPCKAVIQGDLSVPQISAASILAKVARDDEMVFADDLFPQYALHKHKGYPTRQHIQAIQQYGITEFHRKSFAPVKKLLDK